MLPKRYITTKRDAESTIASSLPRLRSIFMRPGFLYDRSRLFTMPIALAGNVGALFNSLTGGRLSSIAGAAVELPIKPDLVANAVLEAIENPKCKGVIDRNRMEMLGSDAFKRKMMERGSYFKD